MKKMLYGATSHNRSVYASPPLAARGSVSLGRLRLPHSTPPTFLRLLERFAFLYRNHKNVIYSRNVMRN
jgi:hypothetical protein